MLYIRIVLISLCCFSALSVAQQRQAPVANVMTQSVNFSPMKITIEAVGTAEAVKSVSLYPAAADKVTEVRFKPGQFVKQGEVLLTLDSRRQQAALQRAQIQLADAERTLNRLLTSFKEGAVTQSSVDDAITQRDLAKVAVVQVSADLDDRSLVAPFSGYVGLTDVEKGDRIDLSTLVTTIDDRSQLFVNFSLPESAIGLVDETAQVEIEPWNSRDTIISASLAQFDSRIDQQDRTMRVRAAFENTQDKYRPGLSFKVMLTLAGVQYPEIPEAALAWGATGAYVWLAQDNKAVRVPVAIQQRLRGSILVDANIQQGDLLIVEGIQRLRPGQTVKAINQPLVNN